VNWTSVSLEVLQGELDLTVLVQSLSEGTSGAQPPIPPGASEDTVGIGVVEHEHHSTRLGLELAYTVPASLQGHFAQVRHRIASHHGHDQEEDQASEETLSQHFLPFLLRGEHRSPPI
jgi:hypothetical protein